MWYDFAALLFFGVFAAMVLRLVSGAVRSIQPEEGESPQRLRNRVLHGVFFRLMGIYTAVLAIVIAVDLLHPDGTQGWSLFFAFFTGPFAIVGSGVTGGLAGRFARQQYEKTLPERPESL